MNMNLTYKYRTKYELIYLDIDIVHSKYIGRGRGEDWVIRGAKGAREGFDRS